MSATLRPEIEAALVAIQAMLDGFTNFQECCPQCGEYPCECGLVPDAEKALATLRAALAKKADPEFCPKRTDGSHCHHWWDGDRPCCDCGDDTDRNPADPTQQCQQEGGAE